MRNVCTYVLQTRDLVAAIEKLNAFFGVTVGRATEVKQLMTSELVLGRSSSHGHSQYEYQYDGRGCLHLRRDRLQRCAINTLSSFGSNSASCQRSEHANSDPWHTKLPVH